MPTLTYCDKQGLPESKARLKDILAKVDAADGPDYLVPPHVMFDAVDAINDIAPAIEGVTRESLFKLSAMASAKADELEGRGEKERQARAAESKRLKAAALAKVRQRAEQKESN